MRWTVGCCDTSEQIDIEDKCGWQCDSCRCLYDVSVDGTIKLSPLHSAVGDVNVTDNNHTTDFPTLIRDLKTNPL